MSSETGSEMSPHRRRPTGFVIGVLVIFIVVAVAAALVSAGGNDSKSGARKHVEKTTSSTGTTTTTRGPVEYTVKRGDTLTAIADRFGVAPQQIIQANELADPDHLTEGQVLLIPPSTPVLLVVKPATVQVGKSVDIKLTGAQPAELISFEIRRPAGVFKGKTHSATEDGVVETTYSLGIADTPGTYVVIARGDQVTMAIATFEVVTQERS